MSTREFFKERWTAEQPMFNSVLRALPGDKLDFKPHERSNSAGTIAWMMAEEMKSICDVIEKGTTEWSPRPQPNKWSSRGAFVAGGKEVFSASRGDMVWWILFDLIHHRGQLTAYLRPMGGKVPGIYGPSADDAGQA